MLRVTFSATIMTEFVDRQVVNDLNCHCFLNVSLLPIQTKTQLGFRTEMSVPKVSGLKVRRDVDAGHKRSDCILIIKSISAGAD